MVGFVKEYKSQIVHGSATFQVGRAQRADLPVLVAMLRDDVLGAGREQDDMEPYEAAFEAIDRDPNHFLMVVRATDGEIVGMMQLTLLPGLARGAATRLQIEGVRVAASQRGTGLGAAMFNWAHDLGRQSGASIAQLTTDKIRADAHRFYDRLGYESSHEGMKKALI